MEWGSIWNDVPGHAHICKLAQNLHILKEELQSFKALKYVKECFSINDYRKRWKIHLIICVLSRSVDKKYLQYVPWHWLDGVAIQVDSYFPHLINWLKISEKQKSVHLRKQIKQKQRAKSNPQKINSQISRALKNAR